MEGWWQRGRLGSIHPGTCRADWAMSHLSPCPGTSDAGDGTSAGTQDIGLEVRWCRSAGRRDRRPVQGARLGPRTPLIITLSDNPQPICCYVRSACLDAGPQWRELANNPALVECVTRLGSRTGGILDLPLMDKQDFQLEIFCMNPCGGGMWLSPSRSAGVHGDLLSDVCSGFSVPAADARWGFRGTQRQGS